MYTIVNTWLEGEKKMSVIVIETRNSIIKAKVSRREQGEIVFSHTLRQFSESEYEMILSRLELIGNSQDYFRVNGIAYVVGESAE
jgi:predicted nucleotidyltransferase